MNSEPEIRKLLKIRADLEDRVENLQIEIDDLNIAIVEIDKKIVGQGFQNSSSGGFNTMKLPEETIIDNITQKHKITEDNRDGFAIQAKDGTILGKLQLTNYEMVFTPKEGLSFAISTPPFQSFLLDRVLGNMKTSDETKAFNGEITADQVLSFKVEVEGEVITRLTINNFGGERRMREIQSSLRWSLDKMYDKMRQG